MTRNANKILSGELEERESAGKEDNIKVGFATLGGGWI